MAVVFKWHKEKGVDVKILMHSAQNKDYWKPILKMTLSPRFCKSFIFIYKNNESTLTYST